MWMTEKTRLQTAKRIMESSLALVEALGFKIEVSELQRFGYSDRDTVKNELEKHLEELGRLRGCCEMGDGTTQ